MEENSIKFEKTKLIDELKKGIFLISLKALYQ